MNERLFHLVPLGAWRRFAAGGEPAWRPASLAREGFCHLSFAAQLAGTLEAWFAGPEELVLLEVELAPGTAGRPDGLRLERSRGGALFPHLHRALRRGELARAWHVGDDRRLPRLARTPAGDRPPGVPLLVAGPGGPGLPDGP